MALRDTRGEDWWKPVSTQPPEPPRYGATRAEARDLTGHVSFLGEFLRQPLTVGAVWPSSPSLARAIVDSCDFAPGETVIELGPGTGAFTGLILERLRGRGRFLAVEINEANATLLRQKFPRCEVIHDSAENLGTHLGRGQADCIVSGLAWGSMRPRMQDAILRALLRSLDPNGQLVAFAYVHALWFPSAQRFRRRLEQSFTSVETTPVIWRNLPPALVYRCSNL